MKNIGETEKQLSSCSSWRNYSDRDPNSIGKELVEAIKKIAREGQYPFYGQNTVNYSPKDQDLAFLITVFLLNRRHFLCQGNWPKPI